MVVGYCLRLSQFQKVSDLCLSRFTTHVSGFVKFRNLKSTLAHACQWLTGCITNAFCGQHEPGKWDSDFRRDFLG